MVPAQAALGLRRPSTSVRDRSPSGRTSGAPALTASQLGEGNRSTPAAIGGEQAANTLQPDGSSRHTTTANAKVRGAIEALRLVTRCRCLRSLR